MTVSEMGWQSRLSALVDQLSRRGDLRSVPWRAAFEETPRHVFVPTVITISESGSTTVSGSDPVQHQSWLDQVYSDDSLITQCMAHPSIVTAGAQPLLVSTSSSTMPSLMARMLEALDVRDGHRVLEIGTGTGYNTALLCHRLGSDNVVSIDIDPSLIAAAKDHLASLGHDPVLVAGDGTAGVAQHGTYDRIIATAAVPEIPLPWIEQLAPGGKILVNLRGELAGGTLCLLTKDDHDEEAIGPVLPLGGHFMWLRPQADSPERAPESTHTPAAPGTRLAPAPHSTPQPWSATTASDSCCNSNSAESTVSAVRASLTRALVPAATECSSKRATALTPRSSPLPNSTNNTQSSRPVPVASGTVWRPLTSYGTISADPTWPLRSCRESHHPVRVVRHRRGLVPLASPPCLIPATLRH